MTIFEVLQNQVDIYKSLSQGTDFVQIWDISKTM